MGQAEGLVGPGVLVVANSDQRRLEQAHHGRQHLAPTQAGLAQLGLDGGADAREGVPESQHPPELGLVTERAPSRIVSVLLAPFRVPAGGQEMAMANGRDPHLLPSRRDRQPADPAQGIPVLHQRPVGRAIAEAAAGTASHDAADPICDVAQPQLAQLVAHLARIRLADRLDVHPAHRRL